MEKCSIAGLRRLTTYGRMTPRRQVVFSPKRTVRPTVRVVGVPGGVDGDTFDSASCLQRTVVRSGLTERNFSS
jgi:hypothetical protein